MAIVLGRGVVSLRRWPGALKLAARRLPSDEDCFTFRYPACQDGWVVFPVMTTSLFLELFAGFLAAGMALWFVVLSRSESRSDATPAFATAAPPWLRLADGRGRIPQALASYVWREGLLANLGLLLLRLSIGVMMIHHGQEKLADPQQFASTYVASLHLPFPLFFAYAAGFSELIGSWLLILGLLSPLGALAITGTMTVAAYQHILTAGLNIYVLELVVLYLGGSVALLLLGPGRFSFDGAIVADLMREPASEAEQMLDSVSLAPAYVQVSDGERR